MAVYNFYYLKFAFFHAAFRYPTVGLETRNLYDFVVQVILTTDFVRFMKINSNRSKFKLSKIFEFQIVNLSKSDKDFFLILG